MAAQTDKNILKQYFRSGSRPTQNQFYELIDNCYNDQQVFSSFVSGYDVRIDTEQDTRIAHLKREAGRTFFAPVFDRINTTHLRTYHYAIPVCQIGEGFGLESVLLDIRLPESAGYTIMDKSKGKNVQITQVIKLTYVKIYNADEEIFTLLPADKPIDFPLQLSVNKQARQWRGISIDLAVEYTIKSDIAISDQLDITAENPEVLRHVFGSAGCIFNPHQ